MKKKNDMKKNSINYSNLYSDYKIEVNKSNHDSALDKISEEKGFFIPKTSNESKK